MNRSDSQIMAILLKGAGWEEVNSPERADVIILNTCNVKTPTEQRMVHRARVLSKFAPLVAAGCMAKSQTELLEPYAIALVAPRAIGRIVEAAEAAAEGKRVRFLDWEFMDKAAIERPPIGLVGIVPIAEGCLGSCKYCITKFARGGLTSFKPENIMERIISMLKLGAVEIWLTAEDTGVYGWDIDTDLPSLLSRIDFLPGDFRVRIGMMTPDAALRIKERLKEILASSRKLYRFLHLPVQSGSDRVLRLMGRRYTSSEFIELVRELRMAVRDLTIATDVIVGYPGEDEDDFQRTLRLLETVEPDIVNLSRFGPRPGTPAAQMLQLPVNVVKKRSREAMEIIERIKLSRNEKYLGREVRVLASERTSKGTQG